MLTFIKHHLATVRATVAAGRVDIVERRYFPAVFGLGLVLGCAISFVLSPIVVVVFMGFGFAVGYAVRSYVSSRRRERFLRNRSL